MENIFASTLTEMYLWSGVCSGGKMSKLYFSYDVWAVCVCKTKDYLLINDIITPFLFFLSFSPSSLLPLPPLTTAIITSILFIIILPNLLPFFIPFFSSFSELIFGNWNETGRYCNCIYLVSSTLYHLRTSKIY